MALLDLLTPKARTANLHIVLPEGHDPRVCKAAAILSEQQICRVTVLATEEEVTKSCQQAGVSTQLPGVEFVDWTTSEQLDVLANAFQQRRAHKGVDLEKAKVQLQNRLYFANMMVQQGLADGLVAGSIASTPDMLRASFQCIGTAEGIRIGSSCFVMDLDRPAPAGDDILIYADCGVNPNPDAEALVDIAISTGKTYQALLGEQPRIAFLSFSTRGSAKHELVDKMQAATKMTQERVKSLGLDYIVDGELQADAALVPGVAAKKCADSALAGSANVLIFPDLQAGNIAYKLTERLAGAQAFGPILQGLAKPVNDLSRGCSAEDIAGVTVITLCQAAS